VVDVAAADVDVVDEHPPAPQPPAQPLGRCLVAPDASPPLVDVLRRGVAERQQRQQRRQRDAEPEASVEAHLVELKRGAECDREPELSQGPGSQQPLDSPQRRAMALLEALMDELAGLASDGAAGHVPAIGRRDRLQKLRRMAGRSHSVDKLLQCRERRQAARRSSSGRVRLDRTPNQKPVSTLTCRK